MEPKYKLKQIIKELEKIKGRHTELVTVYVPAGFNLNVITSHLSQELGTAQNIKSKTTRKNVINALEKVLQELKKYKKTPENGMAIFCGNVSGEEGRPEYKIWVIEPPEPLGIRLYRCDQQFILDPLKDMLEAKYAYGLLLIDDKNACIGVLKGKRVVCLKEMKSIVPGKFKAGGQSAPRFQRLREELKKDWFRKVSQTAIEEFKKIENLRGILLGGPGPTKEIFLNGGWLKEFGKKVIGVKDVGYTTENGLRDLVEKCEDILQKEEIMEEKRIVGEFLENLAKETGLAIYGENEVRKALEAGAVEKLLLSEEIPIEKIEEFSEIAKQFSTQVFIISTETPEGEQLFRLGGFGAIARYRLG